MEEVWNVPSVYVDMHVYVLALGNDLTTDTEGESLFGIAELITPTF